MYEGNEEHPATNKTSQGKPIVVPTEYRRPTLKWSKFFSIKTRPRGLRGRPMN